MMGNYLRLMFVSTMIMLLSVACMRGEDTDSKSVQLAPDFKLQDLSQNRITLSSYKNKQPVIILFWTTWCPYCVQALASLSQMYPELSQDGLELLAVDVMEPKYRVDNFIKRHNFIFKVLLDKDASVAKAYEILGIPTYVLIGRNGAILFKGNSFPQGYKKLISQKQ